MATDATSTGSPSLQANVPSPPSERRAWAIACGTALSGLAVLLIVLLGGVGPRSALAPPAITLVASVPAAQSGQAVVGGSRSGAIVAAPSAAQQAAEANTLTTGTQVHIARRWMEGFYPIYGTAQKTFGVSWLLIASIHMQESAFSTAQGTYHGLNFAHCCGGPMQFNVTNGPVSTWDLVSDSYIYGRRPASYDHMTRHHPSIYDDFDALMAAAHLLSADGAGFALDGSAWDAAYDYYGHDATGVSYADEVLARAIGWSQHGFCINCGVSSTLLAAVHAAYGAPVLAALQAEERAQAQRRRQARAHRASTSTP